MRIFFQNQSMFSVGAVTALLALGIVASRSDGFAARPAATQPTTQATDEPTTQPVNPIVITLHENHASAKRILDDLAGQCGSLLKIPTSDLPAGSDFSIDLDHQPFWPAVSKVGKLLNLDYQVHPDGAVELLTTQGGFDLTFAAPQALFKVELVRWSRTQNFLADSPRSSNCTISIAVAAPPDLLISAGELGDAITTLVDDQGHNLKAQAQLYYSQTYFSFGQTGGTDGQGQMTANISVAELGKEISELSGTITADIGSNLVHISVPITGTKNFTVQLKHLTVQFSNLRNDANSGLSGHMQITRDDQAPSAQVVREALQQMYAEDGDQPMMAMFMPQASVASDKVVDLNFNYRRNFNMGGPMAAAAKPVLKFTMPQTSKQVKIPFTLKHLPLP